MFWYPSGRDKILKTSKKHVVIFELLGDNSTNLNDFFSEPSYCLTLYIPRFIFGKLTKTKWQPKNFFMGYVGPPRNTGISSKLDD